MDLNGSDLLFGAIFIGILYMLYQNGYLTFLDRDRPIRPRRSGPVVWLVVGALYCIPVTVIGFATYKSLVDGENYWGIVLVMGIVLALAVVINLPFYLRELRGYIDKRRHGRTGHFNGPGLTDDPTRKL